MNRLHTNRWIRALMLFVFTWLLSSQSWSQELEAPKVERESREISGWTLHIHSDLLKHDAKKTKAAIELLTAQLEEIVAKLPKPAVEELKKVPLYFSPEYDDTRGGAEFHPNAAWLKENGRDPVMVASVEFTNIANFREETVRMPNFVLHELAHAYHFRFLEDGFENLRIKEAFDKAELGGSYEQVERWHGVGGRTTREKAYALTNPMEYFAETTEAYFGRNDFYPFDLAELQDHDPEMAELLGELWQVEKSTSKPD